MTVHVIVIESSAPLLTTLNTVRQSIVPPEFALNRPASVIAPVPTPAPNESTYTIWFDVTVCEVQGEEVEVITSRGDKWLGGKDFDKELINLISEKYKKLRDEYSEALNIPIDYQEGAEFDEILPRITTSLKKQSEKLFKGVKEKREKKENIFEDLVN